ncbi:DNA internalization-related competence protein ComEC/Rec2 [Vibrio mangrovi]|nr:DNA internalization-related competence protein ComEC/Rec2 [Vibrio mangrovi]MDW6003688.1 DNA internalization-related competence protein ComEC/Rec2 [Vibrio mangrovi]
MIYCLVPVFLLFFSLRIRQLRYIIGICIAFLLILFHGNLIKRQSDILFQSGHDITINAKVDSFFTQNSFGYTGSVRVLSINNTPVEWWRQPRVKLYTATELHPGDVLDVQVSVKPIVGLLNEAGFDSERYYFSQGIVAKVFARSEAQLKTIGDSFRYRLFQHVEQQLQDNPFRGIILALSFANRNELSESQWRLLKNSGLAHLVAISGLHIGIAYTFGFFLGMPVSRFGRYFLWAPVISGGISAVIYSWLAGFSLPTIRALLMLLIHIVLRVSHIRIGLRDRFLVTLGCMLTINPFVSISVSFWMSFTAVFFVFYLVSLEKDRSQQLWLEKLKQQVKGHTALMLCMLPVSAGFFGGISLVAPLYNLIFIPWFSLLIVPLLFVGLVVVTLGGFAGLIWAGISQLLEPVIWSAAFADGVWIFTSAHMTHLFVGLTCILLLQPILSSRIIGFFFLVFWGSSIGRGETTKWQVDILDVGHGLSVLIEKNGHYVLYDTGKSWPGGSMSQSVVTPVLRWRGARNLDGLILSHLDNDHAGGRFDIEKVWHPVWKRASQRLPGYQPCSQGTSWRWQTLKFDVLWPPKQVVKSHNDESCTIRVSDDAEHSILLTGDIEKHSEQEMLQQNLPLASEVVIVPHHGSHTSSSLKWIKKVQADVAVASLAGMNPWHLPSPRIVKRYRDNGTQWLETAISGQIRIIFQQKKRQFNTIRRDTLSPWYRQMLRKQVEWRGYSR